MLRATGCQGGTGGSPPDSGGDGAFAPGVVTGRGLANGAILRSQRRSGREEAGDRSYDVGKSELWCPGFLVPVFLGKRYLTPFPPHDLNFAGLDKPDQKTYNCTVWLLWSLILRSCSRCC